MTTETLAAQGFAQAHSNQNNQSKTKMNTNEDEIAAGLKQTLVGLLVEINDVAPGHEVRDTSDDQGLRLWSFWSPRNRPVGPDCVAATAHGSALLMAMESYFLGMTGVRQPNESDWREGVCKLLPCLNSIMPGHELVATKNEFSVVAPVGYYAAGKEVTLCAASWEGLHRAMANYYKGLSKGREFGELRAAERMLRN